MIKRGKARAQFKMDNFMSIYKDLSKIGSIFYKKFENNKISQKTYF